MPGRRAPLVLVCIAVAAFATLLPGATALDYAVLSPQWVFLPGRPIVILPDDSEHHGEQTLAFLSLPHPRPPPAA